MEAVGNGHAVEDIALARLAADYAEVTRHQLTLLYLWFFIPLGLAVLAAVSWLASKDDEGLDIGAVLFSGAGAVTFLGLITWAIVFRPLTRARQANLHAAGLSDAAPPKRDLSNWVLAWLIAWPIAGIVGAGARAIGLDTESPVAFLAWVSAIWFAKRALDDRGNVTK